MGDIDMVEINATIVKVTTGWSALCSLLYNTSKETVTNVKWTYSDGAVEYGSPASHIFTEEGSYSVTVDFQHSVTGEFYGTN